MEPEVNIFLVNDQNIAFTGETGKQDQSSSDNLNERIANLSKGFNKLYRKFSKRGNFSKYGEKKHEKYFTVEQKRVQCHRCDGYGHIQAECPTVQKKKKANAATWSDSDNNSSNSDGNYTAFFTGVAPDVQTPTTKDDYNSLMEVVTTSTQPAFPKNVHTVTEFEKTDYQDEEKHTQDISEQDEIAFIGYVYPALVLTYSGEAAYYSAKIKYHKGLGVPFAISFFILSIVYSWIYGRQNKGEYEAERKMGLYELTKLVSQENNQVTRVPGIWFFCTDLASGVPPIIRLYVQLSGSLCQVMVIVTMRTLPIKYVLPSERFVVGRFGPMGVYRCLVQYGYKD
ncbi:hypothetical protein H6P81_013876 [Aristolochia fimbriata]|uniref:CCHC-type domain-containing protein n=1 Tax=Aristolochia fimbriata TaxID=158543 RepID=A0AAV7EG56_ARIFI|nr:hypothetical protein H6P81_013876 [Aristolochia fimbriata]